MFNLYLNFQKDQFERHLNTIENDSRNLKQLALMIYEEGQTLKANLKVEQQKVNQLQQNTKPQGQNNLIQQYESQINTLQQQNQARNAVLYQNYMRSDEIYSDQIGKDKEYYEKQINSYKEIINGLKDQIINQKKLIYDNNKTYNQIISILSLQSPNAIEEKLKEYQFQQIQRFRNLNQYKQLQKAQKDLKELIKVETFTDSKQIKEFVLTIKNSINEQLNLSNAVQQLQENNQNQITQEELDLYKEIQKILGSNSEILKQIISALEMILKELDEFNKKQINYEQEIKQKEKIIEQIKLEQDKQEKISKQKLEELKQENEKLFQQKEISKKQLEQTFLNKQDKKIKDFSTEIQMNFIIFAFKIIQNTIEQKKKNLNNSDQILRQLNDIIKFKEPKTQDEFQQLIDKCMAIQILNPSSISLSDLKDLVEKVISALNKIISLQNSQQLIIYLVITIISMTFNILFQQYIIFR